MEQYLNPIILDRFADNAVDKANKAAQLAPLVGAYDTQDLWVLVFSYFLHTEIACMRGRWPSHITDTILNGTVSKTEAMRRLAVATTRLIEFNQHTVSQEQIDKRVEAYVASMNKRNQEWDDWFVYMTPKG